MPIKYMDKCSEHKVRFVPNICSEVELFRTYKLPNFEPSVDGCHPNPIACTFKKYQPTDPK